jgi:undecaprenyl-diphosphatase
MWRLLAALFCFRVAYLAVVPLDLCPDEAYYWDWSRQLDWGYYSKPPLIAWIIALATFVGGASEFAVRLPAAVLGTIGLWPVFALGRSLFDARVGFWAAVAVAATPGMTAMSLLMTIDAPFLCAWAFAVWCVWELLAEKPSAHWLAGAILSTGLGLLAKQTMVALFPLVLIWLACDPSGRRKLRSAALWLWIAGSLLFLAPVVWWNAHHDWITVRHTREHFHARSASLVQHLVYGVEFWASQFGILSPISCGLMIALGIGALSAWRRLDQRVRYLVCLSVIPMLGVTALSFTQRVQPNWPSAFHLTAFVLLAAWGCGAWDGALRSVSRRWFAWGVAVGAVLVAGVSAAPFAIPASSLVGGPLDATARLRGWKTLGQRLGDTLNEFPRPSEALIIAATSRGPVSELAYYLPGQPRVYRFHPKGEVESQHDVWGGPPDGIAGDALIVTPRESPVPSGLAAMFDALECRGRVEVPLGGERREVVTVWRGTGYRGWPAAPIRIADTRP